MPKVKHSFQINIFSLQKLIIEFDELKETGTLNSAGVKYYYEKSGYKTKYNISFVCYQFSGNLRLERTEGHSI